MTTALLWLVGLLAVALMIACRVAFRLWRDAEHDYKHRGDPDRLRYVLAETVKDLGCRGELSLIAQLRDVMAFGFYEAESRLARGIPEYQRSFIRVPEREPERDSVY